MDTDRNLLFGILALQLEFVDSSQFTEACAAWAVAREKSLAEILVERGWITEDDSAEVEQLVARKIEKHAGDARKSLVLEATGEMPSDASSKPSQFEATIDSSDTPNRASQLLETQASDPGSTPSGYEQLETMHYEHTTEERSRYSLTKMHGEGGIGRVWQAHDQRLNRQVALKEIRPDKETSASATKRFAKEAQITSQLEHPNIVPVYELSGSPDSSQSFYTMRFVRGDTFRSAIDTYHRHCREGTATELELRELLNSFIGICNALGYAHSRGVLHRDLKPANVMVGAFGEVIVLDWGLAKMVDQDDDEDELMLESGPISVSDDVEIEATMQGAVLGTLPYMAPEQAAGRIDKIDPRTDIYGLGAILFAILTGDHPHRGTSTREVRSQILNEPTPRVRSENKSVHPVLDAICAKAMAKKRSERYRKARDLAEDVRRWLADEPVECFPESMLARTGRWLRRHRTWAKSIAAALLIVTGVSIAAVMVVDNARRAEKLAKDKAHESYLAEQEAKAEATQRFEEARDAVDTMMTQVSGVLAYFPGMQPLREKLLTHAVQRYEQFVADKSDDVELQAESAQAMIRLGDVFRGLGKYDLAQKTYEDAASRMQQIDSQAARLQFAAAQAQLGILHSDLGEFDKSLAAYDESLLVFDELLESETDATIEYKRTGVVVNRAMLLNKKGMADDAIAALEEAAATFVRLGEGNQEPSYRAGEAMTEANIANVLISLGRNADAIPHANTAISIYQSLSTAHPEHPPYLEALAATRLNLAAAYRTSGLQREEFSTYEAALGDYDLLIASQPDVPLYRERQATARRDVAMYLHTLGNNTVAEEVVRAAITTTESLLNTQMPLAGYHEQWALEQATLGRILSDLDLNADATIHLGAAIERYEELISVDPDFAASYKAQRAACLSAIGTVFQKIGESDSAKTSLTQAADAVQKLLDADRENASYQNLLAWTHKYLSDLAQQAGQQEVAKMHYLKAFEIRSGLLDEPEHLNGFARLVVWHPETATPDVNRAIETANKATTMASDNARFLTTLGSVYARFDKLDEAITTLRAVDDMSPQGGTTHDFWLAMALAKRGNDTDLAEAKNRFDEAVTRMNLHAPGRTELIRLKSEVAELLDSSAKTPEDSAS